MTAPRIGDTILLRADVVSVGPDGWMTIKLRTDDDVAHLRRELVIHARDPAIERGVAIVLAPDEVA